MSPRPKHRGQRGHPGRGSTRPLGPPPAGLFRDVLLAPDREAIPEAHPVVCVRDGEEPAFLREVERRERGRAHLLRRGEDHGVVAELRRDGIAGPRPRRRRRETIESERWTAARPILLPGMASELARELDERELDDLHGRLSRTDGLATWIDRHALSPDFEVLVPNAPLQDPERDLARVVLRATSKRQRVEDLWLKTGRLSTHPGDASLRLRASFGVEGDDDASDDAHRHRCVRSLAEACLPGARALDALEPLWAKLERHLGRPGYGTQHIAYWNAPGGGARFHHDAFALAPGAAVPGQRGVLYAQLTGRTFWLALSIDELLARLREFLGWMQEGDAPHLREALGARWTRVLERSARYTVALTELGLPDAGVFGPVVDAPEFTACLADAGHGLFLHPGDVLLLPNHGLDRTVMHSVFGTAERPGYALSVAIRADESPARERTGGDSLRDLPAGGGEC